MSILLHAPKKLAVKAKHVTNDLFDITCISSNISGNYFGHSHGSDVHREFMESRFYM